MFSLNVGPFYFRFAWNNNMDNSLTKPLICCVLIHSNLSKYTVNIVFTYLHDQFVIKTIAPSVLL